MDPENGRARGISSAQISLVPDLSSIWLYEAPHKLIGDRAYESAPLDERFAEERGVEMIAPHRNNQKHPKTRDGRPLRRYVRRWRLEMLFA